MKNSENLGTADRLIRIVVGAIMLLLVPLALIVPDYEWAFFGFLGVMPLIAGIVGYCPPYALLGIDTHNETRGQDNDKYDVRRKSICC